MNSDICASMTEISEATTEMPTELPSRLDDPMPPGMRLTKENGAAAYDALCDDAVADAFTKITPWLDSPTLIRLLAHAWVENADDLVKIIFQTGNARKNEGGKRDKPQFVKSYLWLMQHFPATALRNFHLIPDNTCLKHTLDILMFTFYGVYKRSDFLSAPERMYQLQVADHKRKREGEFRKDRNARRRLGAKRMREKFAQSKNVPLESLLLQKGEDWDSNMDATPWGGVFSGRTTGAGEKPPSKPLHATAEASNKYRMQKWITPQLSEEYKNFAQLHANMHPNPPANIERELHCMGKSDLIKAHTEPHLIMNNPYSVMYCEVVDMFTSGILQEIRRFYNERLASADGESLKQRCHFYDRHAEEMNTMYRNMLLEDSESDAMSDMSDSGSLASKPEDSCFVPYEATIKFQGLYAKWFPTRNGLHDKALKLNSRISHAIVKQLQKLGTDGRNMVLAFDLPRWKTRGAVDILFDKLSITSVGQREMVRRIIRILREATDVTETLMNKSYDLINYKRVPALCMEKHRRTFAKHDKTRFTDFIDSAKDAAERGDSSIKVNSSTLLPHQVVYRARKLYQKIGDLRRGGNATPENSSDDESSPHEMLTLTSEQEAEIREHEQQLDVLNLQWNSIVQDFRKFPKEARVPMVDVSGSMFSCNTPTEDQPGNIGVALALLLVEMNEGLGQNIEGKVLAFASKPEWVTVWEPEPGNQLRNIGEVAYRLKNNTQCQGYHTNFVEAIRLAVQASATSIVCFSDMRFDSATDKEDVTQWDTHMENLIAENNGTLNTNIVFWNLDNDEMCQQVASSSFQGVIQLAGWSAALLKHFMLSEWEFFSTKFFLKELLTKHYKEPRADPSDKALHTDIPSLLEPNSSGYYCPTAVGCRWRSETKSGRKSLPPTLP